ncbi:MAG: hypothetical protein QHG99_06955 [Methanomicrobiales archaeon]|nr:hypothetical protein [Methanomicrobiales archaeon]
MKRIVAAVIAIFLLGVFMLIAVQLPFGRPSYSDMDDYFLRHGQEETGANNICTAVVFDYRGFDTLGEASVLFSAVVTTGLIFRRLERGD